MRFTGAPSASLLLVLSLVHSPALAGPPAARTASERTASADALFAQGRRLVAEGRLAEACPKLAESQRLDHGVGTLLNLADCYERNGQAASAWAAFRAAASAASAEGQPEREQVAREREAALRSAIARIVVILAGKAPPEVVVKRDDIVIGRELWSAGAPVDPGDHLVTVSAPGKIAWFQTVRVSRLPGARVTVAVPLLADLPAGASEPARAIDAAPDGEPRPGNAQRVAGLAVGGAGIGGVIVGAILGLRAISLNGASSLHCVADQCDRRGMDLRSDAHAAGTASTVAFALAGAALVGGVVLYVTAPSGRRPIVARAGLAAFSLETAW